MILLYDFNIILSLNLTSNLIFKQGFVYLSSQLQFEISVSVSTVGVEISKNSREVGKYVT